jgi:hypothetical protein
MGMLEVALDPATVVVAVDPGKVANRVWSARRRAPGTVGLVAGRAFGDCDAGEDTRRE